MKRKSIFFLTLWIVFVLVGSILSAIMWLLNLPQTDFIIPVPYTDCQKILLLFIIPVCLIPMLCFSCYHAIKEKHRKIKILSIFLIIQHILCLFGLLIP